MGKKNGLVCLVFLSLMALLPFAVSAQITSSVTINSELDLANYGWPVRISGGTNTNPVVVTLGADITLTDFSNYIIIESDYVTFDGNNNTITINTGFSYLGLFQNGNFNSLIKGYSNITIKNIRVSVPGSNSLSIGGGWIGQEGFGFNATDIIIDNCHSDYQSATVGSAAGGIVGRRSPATVTNCSSNGPIPVSGGGICGKFFSGSVVNCHTTGAIVTNGGGITGSFCIGTAVNCYSTGNIGASGGGIMGSDAGNDGNGNITSATATNCYSTGNITGANSGGIMAQKFIGNVTNCYSTGNITGIDAGGIVGSQSPGNVTNCYTIGTEGTNTHGITGSLFTGETSNCISSYSGSWDDNLAASVLTGTDGTVWIGLGSGQPFTLAPYTLAPSTIAIIAKANFGTFTTYSGVPSDTQTMMVSGTLLQSDITIGVPVGYELSISPAGPFSSSISLSPIAGTLDDSPVYIRLTNNVVNWASGNITVASVGSNTQNIATGIAALQSASANLYGSKTVGITTRINKNGVIGLSGVSTNGEIIRYLPSLSATSVISSIGANIAVGGGAILSDGGSAITASGVCWSLTPNPTTADYTTSDGTALSFTSSLTGLITGTTYYVRAYATNSEGTSYGTGVSFTAL